MCSLFFFYNFFGILLSLMLSCIQVYWDEMYLLIEKKKRMLLLKVMYRRVERKSLSSNRIYCAVSSFNVRKGSCYDLMKKEKKKC